MLFQSFEFLILFTLVIVGIAALRQARWQHWLLLIASYVFYGWWDVRFLILILLSGMVNYTAALTIAGMKVSRGQLARLNCAALATTFAFLLIDWTALQQFAGSGLEPLALLRPWCDARLSITGCVCALVLFNLFHKWAANASPRTMRRAYLVASVVFNLGMLGLFKYYNFFADSLIGVAHFIGYTWQPSVLTIALPVGISFFTFQTMSYTIDVFRGDIKPEKSFLRMALFVAYFPQLVAGPILRPNQFLPSLDTPWRVLPENLTRGTNLILVGLVKKVLVADYVGPLADQILLDPFGQSSAVIFLGTTLFAVQIYCDFSGYTDIARGVSRVFGVEIPLNFNYPYFSTSIIDFWRRWHISLSTWLRDYLYIPLGGGRVSASRIYVNLMITMILGGLWHGAAWNFAIWGAYQGILLCINRWLRTRIVANEALNNLMLTRPMTVVRWAATMYFMLLGWLFFRIQDPQGLLYATGKFIIPDGRIDAAGVGLGRGGPAVAAMAFIVFSLLHAYGYWRGRWDDRLDRLHWFACLTVYALLAMIFFIAWPSTNAAFIYFQF